MDSIRSVTRHPSRSLRGIQSHPSVRHIHGQYTDTATLYGCGHDMQHLPTDSTSNSEIEEPFPTSINTRKVARRITNTELLLLPPFFSQVDQPNPINIHNELLDSIESNIDTLDCTPISTQRILETVANASPTTMRTRLKVASLVAKTLTYLRRKKLSKSSGGCHRAECQIGDGFELSERRLVYRYVPLQRPKRSATRIVYTRCLDLKFGPLPPVHFTRSSSDVIQGAVNSVSGTSSNSSIDCTPVLYVGWKKPDTPKQGIEPETERMIAEAVSDTSKSSGNSNFTSRVDGDEVGKASYHLGKKVTVLHNPLWSV